MVIAQSTGHRDLDDSCVRAFEEWLFKANTLEKLSVPVTFLSGGGYGQFTFSGGAKALDKTLASYLGQGVVLNGSGPIYPTSPPWTYKKGHGVYELHVGKNGSVTEVRLLKSSGDAAFDGATKAALSQWRFAKAPFILELPLPFVLTPLSFNVYVAR